MKTYSINYNLRNPNRDYEPLVKRVKAFGHGWCHCGGSHWFINSELTCTQVRDALKPYLDADDQLIVSTVGDDWATWQMPKAVADWLHQNWHSACTIS